MNQNRNTIKKELTNIVENVCRRNILDGAVRGTNNEFVKILGTTSWGVKVNEYQGRDYVYCDEIAEAIILLSEEYPLHTILIENVTWAFLELFGIEGNIYMSKQAKKDVLMSLIKTS